VTTFAERLRTASEQNESLLCVGLDLDLERMPAHLRAAPGGPAAFADAIVAATADLVCAYKPNLAFYLADGLSGLGTLSAVIASIRRRAPAVPIVLDAKFNDIDISAARYARFAWDVLGVDAVTVNPYLGEDGLRPFFERPDRGAFVLCKTSNPGSGDLQDVPAGDEATLYRLVARRIAGWQARYGTLGAVVGATYPRQVGEVRALLPGVPLLVPGVGAQGGALAATVQAGAEAARGTILVNASRAVLYAGGGTDFAEQARTAALALRAALEAARPGA
jgi:orotidine-5'-phosphate decarboxylase